ncbi:NAD(P)H-dependent glycerol-3-phosphate dehydrogenase [Bacillaceae bacterium]
MNKQVAVIGAGSWGTALATVLSDKGYEVRLWSRSEAVAAEINRRHTNRRYLPEAVLPESISCSTSLADVARGQRAFLIVVPSHAMREVIRALSPHLSKDALIIHATKGLETETLKRMSEVIAEELPASFRERIVCLSGPSHAEEVVRKSPTTVVVAAHRLSLAEAAQDLLMTNRFRVYTNPDVIGVEIGGALKNVIALGAGLSDGLGFGDNAKAALMTRGLAEIGRLGVALGANPLTFAGLAGVGDLIVTCTSRYSRNWRAGNMLAQGKPLDEVLRQMGMVVEGVKTTKAAYELAKRHEVVMPITTELYKVLFERKPVKDAVEDLMGRVRTHEMEKVGFDESGDFNEKLDS